VVLFVKHAISSSSLLRARFAVLQGLVDSDGAVMMVEPRHLDQLLHPMFENEKAYQRDVITKGLGASPGAAVGKLVFTAGA
jgi:pyruvate,orthophosphate dikinase